MKPAKFCRNPNCGDEYMDKSMFGMCPTCRWAGKTGMFWGGAIIGFISAALKLIPHIIQHIQ